MNSGDGKPREENKSTGANIANRIQEMEVRISGIEDTTEEIDTSVIENAKSEKFMT